MFYIFKGSNEWFIIYVLIYMSYEIEQYMLLLTIKIIKLFYHLNI